MFLAYNKIDKQSKLRFVGDNRIHIKEVTDAPVLRSILYYLKFTKVIKFLSFHNTYL